MTNSSSTEQAAITTGGRRIAVRVSGPDDGSPVLFCHVAPGSRRFDPDPKATAAAEVRLITMDRPGYGGSDRLGADDSPSIPLYAEDCAAVLEQLGVRAAAVAGWSAGGRVAMALAARRPDLVRSVALIGTPAPDEEVAWIGATEKSMIAALAADPDSALVNLEQMLAPMTADPAATIGMVGSGPADAAALADPGLRADLEEMLTEAFVQGSAGLAADLLSYTLAPWGFDPRSVGAPVRCWYGAADAVVSPAHGQWWVDQVADGRLTVVPEAGHLLVRPVWADVLRWSPPTHDRERRRWSAAASRPLTIIGRGAGPWLGERQAPDGASLGQAAAGKMEACD
ncbi:MAG: alpha/beta fold hydrolase [Geodermatophilaceae bacterium]